MPRIRTIKPEFPQSESMGRISRDARLLFVLLWTICDDSGRARGNSRMLASLLFPYDDDAPKLINDWLCELENEGCISQYSVDGDCYLEVRKWLKHQKIDKPSVSRLPSFDDASRILSNARECSSLDLVPGPSTKDLGPSRDAREQVRDASAQNQNGEILSSKKKTSKASAWPLEAVVPEDWIAAGEAERAKHKLPVIDLRLEAARFQNYWASVDKPKKNWRLTWMNWVLSERVGKNYNGSTGNNTILKSVENIISLGAALDAAKAERSK